ncbi:MAG TPA: tetratricopeptide repeat protein, partial [Methylomirabilota bacterium]|nr:tetratricopeptide repeat protein [Methylomirabilota bacterium]
DDAASVYREIIARFPAETEAPYRLGQVLRAQRRPAEARKAFQRCLEINTNHLPATVQLIELDLAATNHAAALTRVEAEIARQTNSPSLHVLRAMVYRAQKDDARAEGALKRAIEVDPTFTPAYLELARLYVAGNRAAEAIRNLEDALEKDAKNLSAYLLLGSIHERAGAYAAARDAYERALKVNPSFVIALNNLAYLYAEHLQDPGKGYEHALKARRLAPREPFIADTLGWIHYHRGEYAEAVNLLQESVEGMRSERDRTEVLYHLGMAQYMMGLEAPARVSLQRALQNPDFTGRAEAERRLAILDARLNPADKNAVADLRRRVAENPKDIITLTRLGDVLGAQGDAAGAREAYEQALKLNPRAFGPTVRLAELYAGPLREPEKAMELAKAARSLAPGDPQVAWTLGRLAFQARDYPWSHSLLQEAAARLSTRPDFLYDLALAQYSVGRVAEAERNMQQALQLPGAFSQTNAARWFVTLTALVRNPTQAPALEAQVRQMLAANGDYVPGLMALGLIEEQRKNPAEARKAYEKALSIYPQFLPASVRLAGLYAEHFGELQRAYDVALKARTAQPEDPELAKVLGKIVYRRKDYPYAVRLFQETTRKVPSDAEAFYYLGLAHHQLQQPAEARQALHQALGLQLEPVLAREANRLLAELK